MRFKAFWGVLLFCGLWPVQAAADNRFIVRHLSGLAALQQVCATEGCTVVRALDGNLNQLFLLTTSDDIDPSVFLSILRNIPGVEDAEPDQVVSLVGGLDQVTTPPSGLSDTSPVTYFGASVWNGYANQPSAQIVRVSEAQTTFNVTGTGIVADIDTGVDPNHPGLQGVLLEGYDFTRNQPGGSELNDISSSPCPFTSCPPPPCPNCSPVKVNQSTAAVLDQSTAAVLDGSSYAAFGHGTMVMGVIHLVAPTAKLLPLKVFHSDGTGSLSDILNGIYYAVENNANVINMSFDTKTDSFELSKALDYANQQNVICAASAGNDGQMEVVYPAALQTDVMGVASTSDVDQRSIFSNFGDAIVWVAAPGEAIISTYPFSTYAAGWGTSFSAPFVSGAAALLLNRRHETNESQAASAVARAVPVGPDMGHGRLDLVQALDVPPAGSIDSPAGDVIIEAGQSVLFSGSGTDPDGTVTGYSWSFPGGNPCSSGDATPGNVTYASPGTYVASLTVTDNVGLNDPNPKTRTVSVLPAFSLSSTPSSLTVPPGAVAKGTVTVTPGANFAGTVNFSVTGLPSGVTASFNPASLTGSGSTTFAVTTATATHKGSYRLTIKATSGRFSHATHVILVVNASGFSVSVTPSRAKIRRDTSGTYAVTVAALEGFTGTVDLSATGLPSGAAAAFNPPAITTSGTSVLTVHVGNSTRTGTYKVTVSGKSGSLLPSVGIILKVR